MVKVKVGIENLRSEMPSRLKNLSFGVLVHPASVDSKLQHTVDILMKDGFRITALLGPQHGIRGETQDNMVEWEGFTDAKTRLPVFSLYGKHRKPTTEMLSHFDCLMVDLQDVGARYYTFIWTMDLAMSACAQIGMPVVVLDRPNPINGVSVQGNVMEDMNFSSFVGLKPLPVRHAMTIGEIACYLKDVYYPSLDLSIIKMKGWRRELWFDQTNLSWVMPSPNMPTLDTATVYPGQCLLEGTNLSEGRGTTRPFEIFGAPFIDPDRLVSRLKDYRLKGVVFRPLYFIPTFQKHAGLLCGGAQIHVIDRKAFRPFKTSVAILKAVRELYPEERLWRDPPYEYEYEKLPIDILAGSDNLRLGIDKGKALREMEHDWQLQCERFNRLYRTKYLLYS